MRSRLDVSYAFEALTSLVSFWYTIQLSILFDTQSKPVEEYYRRKGLLLEFEIQGGIPETWPRLLRALHVEEGVVSQMAN